MYFDISSLPPKVSCSIFGSWLTLKSLVLLDSSSRNSKRYHLRQLFGVKEFVHQNPVVLHDAKLIKWLQARSLHILNVVFGANAEPSQPLVQYLAKFRHLFRSETVTIQMRCTSWHVSANI